MLFQENTKGSLSDQVFHKIEDAILNGQYSPGESLTELKLSAELGVSRTPVREALRQLELGGLVKMIPNKGAVVIGISEKDIEDIYTIRMAIEGLSARWAAQNITPEELKTMQELIELQDFYASKGDILQVWHLDKSFHEQLYESCRSRPLKYMLSSFHNYIQKARAASFKESGRTAKSIEEHRQIYLAIRDRDPDRAEKMASYHIEMAKKSILHSIAEQKKG